MRRCLTQFVFAAAISLPLPALAQNQNCPNGAWFCEQVEVEVQLPASPSVPPVRPAQPPPVVVVEAPPPALPPAPPAHRQGQPPVVIYQPAPAAQTRVIIVTPGYGPNYGPPSYNPGYYAPSQPVRPALVTTKPKTKPVWQSEFGLNMRVEGAYVGRPEGARYNSGLGGIGLSLRYRPVPGFAFDAGVDVLGGTDYNGFHRTEIPISLSGLMFVNPKSRSQFYFMVGANYSRASVRSDLPTPLLTADVDEPGTFAKKYSYFGVHGGLGLEFRLSKRVAINVDGIVMVRKRLGENETPEFRDPETGKTTNTSGGGLFRGGLTLWW